MKPHLRTIPADEFIYETPVYCGAMKVWRVLNLNSGTVYSSNHETLKKAERSIEHGKKRAGLTVQRIGVFELRELVTAHKVAEKIRRQVKRKISKMSAAERDAWGL